MSAPSHLSHELAAFTQQRPNLLSEHGAGKFALFIGGMFQGAFADRVEALKKGYAQGGDGHFFGEKDHGTRRARSSGKSHHVRAVNALVHFMWAGCHRDQRWCKRGVP